MATDRPVKQRLLIAVDDSDPAERAVRYAGRVVGGRPDFELLLYHQLPAMPPELRDHGGSEDPQQEAGLSQDQAHRIGAWVRELADQTRPVLERHRDRLTEAGVPRDVIDFVLDEDVLPGEPLSDALRRAARARDCHTIVIAREHLSGLREAFTQHVSDDLARHPEGFAIWVVD